MANDGEPHIENNVQKLPRVRVE